MMEINITCNTCGQKLVGYNGPDKVTVGIDPHTCAPAPMPEPPEGVVLQSPHEFLGIPEPAPVCAQCGAPVAEQAPAPDVVWESEKHRVSDCVPQSNYRRGKRKILWEGNTSYIAKEMAPALAACVRALRAQEDMTNAETDRARDYAETQYDKALLEARALGVKI